MIFFFYKKLKNNFYFIFYFFVTFLSIYFIFVYNYDILKYNIKFFRNFFIPFIIINYFFKFFFLLIIFFFKFLNFFYINIYIFKKKTNFTIKNKIIKINKILPIFILFSETISGAYNYKLKKIKISLPNLPKSFHGIKIGHFSDLHSGNFFNKIAVEGGVNILKKQKPDVVFFTGDLVNYQTNEMTEYVNIFNKINPSLGVYSILGNHDYGDYMKWNSLYHKYKNFLDMIKLHKFLNWNLLLNKSEKIIVGNSAISIIGVENWGFNKFPKYGNLNEAYKNINQNISTKLLLSHDPSHWDAEVIPIFNDIDITFSGHTHGFQLGIETSNFKWSPCQYKYKQWAGLYTKKNQYLYVNRGFGCIGYPGRIGIFPELTILELQKKY